MEISFSRSALNVQEDCYQLLVTLPGASPGDVEYCQAIEEFVKRNQLPAVIGFGEELLAGGNQRVIESGEILRYGLIVPVVPIGSAANFSARLTDKSSAATPSA